MKVSQKFSCPVSSQKKDGEGDLCLFRMPGDCMEPTIKSGDVVVANMREKKIIDGLYLVNFHSQSAKVRGGPTVRRLQHRFDGNILIICDNPLYRPPYSEHSIVKLKELNVIGRCIGITKRI